MKDINTYIIEKLKLDNFTKVSNEFEPGDYFSSVWFEDFEDEDTEEVITLLRIAPDNFIFKEKNKDTIIYIWNNKYRNEDSIDIFINSNEYYEAKSNPTVFLSIKDTKLFLEEYIKIYDDETADFAVFLSKYFDRETIKKYKDKCGIYHSKEDLQKMLRSLKRKYKNV